MVAMVVTMVAGQVGLMGDIIHSKYRTTTEDTILVSVLSHIEHLTL